MSNSIIYNNIIENNISKSFAFIPLSEITKYQELLPESISSLVATKPNQTICLVIDSAKLNILYRPLETLDENILTQIKNSSNEPFNFYQFLFETQTLKKFIIAQENTFTYALKEIKSGSKIGHWMWYTFPQIVGLGYTETAKYFAIKDLNEARMYLHNKFLYNNLITICQALLENDNDINSILGEIDALKLRSCMTLFLQVDDNPIFQSVLKKFYKNNPDEKTLSLLNIQKH